MGVGPFSSSSDTSFKDDHSNRPVAATDGSTAISIQGKGTNKVQTGGITIGKGGSLSIYNEAPTTATNLLSDFVKSQANTGLSSAVPIPGGSSQSPQPLDKKLVVVIAIVALILGFVVFKKK